MEEAAVDYFRTDPIVTPAARQPKEILVELRRRAEEERLLSDGYKTIDVTSSGPNPVWRTLSPFYPHGGIPLPWNDRRTSASVEGLWQGLKVFEHEGVDLEKLENTTLKNLKRGGKTRGKVLYHWWGPLDAEEPEEAVGYVEARKRIYIPAYTWVLENRSQEAVAALAREALNSKLVLLDTCNNSDVENERTPLSHAALLRTYIIENFQRLISTP